MVSDGDEKYEVLNEIGSFGTIIKVRRRTDNAIICRKQIKYGKMSQKEKDQLRAEIEILSALRHPNIVQYYHRDHLRDTQELYIYMEYCGNGDLGGYIKKLKSGGRYADEEFVWQIMAQLVGALYRCHYGEDPPKPGCEEEVNKDRKVLQSKQGPRRRVIIHRDLKPENVFLGHNNAVKLGDFGLSKEMERHNFASTYVGTPFYMAPEINACERYSHHADVWSLGCIIYELATRCVPFDAQSHAQLAMKIKDGKTRPLPSHYSQELTDVIAWCLKVNPSQRPDTAQILNVPQIKAARQKLEDTLTIERLQQERDTAFAQLSTALKQVQDLQSEVQRLRDAGKKIEMEWHAKATLAIDQRVSEAQREQERQKSEFQALLQKRFEQEVEIKVQEALDLHQASLPQSHGLGQGAEKIAVNVRSSTPPPGGPHQQKASQSSSFATTAAGGSFTSSVAQSGADSAVDTDLSALSFTASDDPSPLALRAAKPPPPSARNRLPFGRAKTLANCTGNLFAANAATASTMDVHMADPSPMPRHIAAAPGSMIKGLSLSPRRSGRRRSIGNGGRASEKRGLFDLAEREPLRSKQSSFADDYDDEDDEELLDEPASPSRPASRVSSTNNSTTAVHQITLGEAALGGDPFKALSAQQPPPAKRPLRPSLGRQQTMPVQMAAAPPPRQQRGNIFFAAAAADTNTSKDNLILGGTDKENRPPSRPGIPVLSTAAANTSPKRPSSTSSPSRPHPKNKILTPSGKLRRHLRALEDFRELLLRMLCSAERDCCLR